MLGWQKALEYNETTLSLGPKSPFAETETDIGSAEYVANRLILSAAWRGVGNKCQFYYYLWNRFATRKYPRPKIAQVVKVLKNALI